MEEHVKLKKATARERARFTRFPDSVAPSRPGVSAGSSLISPSS
jgi:hypothetical protein